MHPTQIDIESLTTQICAGCEGQLLNPKVDRLYYHVRLDAWIHADCVTLPIRGEYDIHEQCMWQIHVEHVIPVITARKLYVYPPDPAWEEPATCQHCSKQIDEREHEILRISPEGVYFWSHAACETSLRKARSSLAEVS